MDQPHCSCQKDQSAKRQKRESETHQDGAQQEQEKYKQAQWFPGNPLEGPCVPGTDFPDENIRENFHQRINDEINHRCEPGSFCRARYILPGADP